MSSHALELKKVGKSYPQGSGELEILRSIEFGIKPGEIVALVAPSGAGKSTLLQIAGLLDKPSHGEVWIAGTRGDNASDDVRTGLRRTHMGFVYQFHHLLREFSAVENVMLPQMIGGLPTDRARKRALELLARLGLEARAEHRPARLSGGEQQRAAIARAIANRPALLLADEPTGNLDPATAASVFELLVSLARDEGVAALIATHNLELAAKMDRQVTLKGGMLA